MVGTRKFEHHANLCPSRQTECKKDHGTDKLTMRKTYKKPIPYRLTNPPKALLKARHDNIAIVPASMLPFQKTLQELINTLPQGAVFLCHAEENTKQRKLLERVEETFRQQGHAVMNLSMKQVYNDIPNF